jgi:hypothetical protein
MPNIHPYHFLHRTKFLKTTAKRRATNNGHSLSQWTLEGDRFFAYCKACKCQAVVDIAADNCHGEATEYQCLGDTAEKTIRWC